MDLRFERRRALLGGLLRVPPKALLGFRVWAFGV